MCYTVHKRSHASLCERLIKVRSGHFLDWYYSTSQLISTTDPINDYSSQQVQFKFYLMKNWRENFSFFHQTVWIFFQATAYNLLHLYKNQNRTRILLVTMNLHPILSYKDMKSDPKLPLHLTLLLYKLSKGTATLGSDFAIF